MRIFHVMSLAAAWKESEVLAWTIVTLPQRQLMHHMALCCLSIFDGPGRRDCLFSERASEDLRAMLETNIERWWEPLR